jgi:hypothetical protein
MIMILEAML